MGRLDTRENRTLHIPDISDPNIRELLGRIEQLWRAFFSHNHTTTGGGGALTMGIGRDEGPYNGLKQTANPDGTNTLQMLATDTAGVPYFDASSRDYLPNSKMVRIGYADAIHIDLPPSSGGVEQHTDVAILTGTGAAAMALASHTHPGTDLTNLDFTDSGHGAIGTNASIGASYVLDVHELISDALPIDAPRRALRAQITLNHSSYSGYPFIYGLISAVQISAGNANALGGVIVGLRAHVYHGGDGNAHNSAAIEAKTPSVYGAGDLDRAYGIIIYDADASGTGEITEQYGLYISEQTKGTSIKYNLFSLGATAKHYIQGLLGIGVAVPTDPLEVAGNVKATTLQSTQTTGTAPLTVASTTVVPNLNADTVDGYHAADLLAPAVSLGRAVCFADQVLCMNDEIVWL